VRTGTPDLPANFPRIKGEPLAGDTTAARKGGGRLWRTPEPRHRKELFRHSLVLRTVYRSGDSTAESLSLCRVFYLVPARFFAGFYGRDCTCVACLAAIPLWTARSFRECFRANLCGVALFRRSSSHFRFFFWGLCSSAVSRSKSRGTPPFHTYALSSMPIFILPRHPRLSTLILALVPLLRSFVLLLLLRLQTLCSRL